MFAFTQTLLEARHRTGCECSVAQELLLIGPRRSQQRHTRVVWSEQCRGLRGTAWHKRQVSAGFFGSGARAALLVHRACVLPLLQEVSAMGTTRLEKKPENLCN